jgi:hypothetical protein
MTALTIPFSDRRRLYDATAGQVDFDYDWPITSAAYIEVQIKRVATGESEVLTTDDFSVSGVGQQNGGAVTLTTGAAEGDLVLVQSNFPEARPANIGVTGPLRSSDLNADMAHLTVVVQQLRRDMDYCVRGDIFSTADAQYLPAANDRAGKFLYFNGDGNLRAGNQISLPVSTYATDLLLAETVDEFLAASGFAGRGGFYPNHHELDAGRPNGVVHVIGDRILRGPTDDLKPGRGYVAITSIVRSGTTATAISNAHGRTTGQVLQITGGNEADFLGKKTITVTGPNTFTYPISGSAAASASGDLHWSLISGVNNWLEELRACTVKNHQAIIMSSEGLGALITGVRASDNAVSTEDAIAGSNWAYNDVNSALQRVYAGLDEAITIYAGGAIGREIDIVQGGVAATPISAATPYVNGSSIALWLASGGQKSTKPFPIFPASCALGIVANGESFLKGIIFGYNALYGCNGTTGSAVALEFITGHAQQWLNPAGALCAAIKTGGTVTTYAQALNFSNNGASFQNANGTVDFFRVSGLTTDLNGVHVIGGATGAGVKFLTIGETNVDMIFETAGSGVIKTSDPLWVYFSGSTSGDPTAKGMIRLCNPGGAAGSSGGVEWLSTRFGSGYGWRMDTPDEGGGSTPMIVYNRANNAAWTEHTRFVANGGIRMPVLAADPTSVANGDIYYNSAGGYAKVRAAGAWHRASFAVQAVAAFTGQDNAQAGATYAKVNDLNTLRSALVTAGILT